MGFPGDPLSGAAICPCVPASSPYPGELTTPLSPLTSVARALPSRCPAPQHHRPTSKSPREEGRVCSQTPPRQIQGSQPQSLGAPQPVTFRERIGKPGPGMPHPTTAPSSSLTLSSRTQKPWRRGGGRWRLGWFCCPRPTPQAQRGRAAPLSGRAPCVPSLYPGDLGASGGRLAPSTWPRLSQRLLCGHLLFGRPLLGPVRTARPQAPEHRPFLLLS